MCVIGIDRIFLVIYLQPRYMRTAVIFHNAYFILATTEWLVTGFIMQSVNLSTLDNNFHFSVYKIMLSKMFYNSNINTKKAFKL
jgi:hypothetical protein